MAPGQPGRSYKIRLAMMIFAIAGMNIGYTAILPFLPQVQGQLRLTPVLLTSFLLGYPAAKIATQAFAGGRMTDRYGPAATAAIAWGMGAAGMAVIASAGTAAGLFGGQATAIIGRVIWGAGTGIGIPALYRAAGLMAGYYDVPVARLRAAIGAGAVLTLALGPVVAAGAQLFAGFRVVLITGAALSLLGAVTSLHAMRIPAVGPSEQGEPDGAGPGEEDDSEPGWLLPLIAFGLMELILNLLFAAAEPLVPLYVARHSGDPAARSSLILTVGLGVWVVVTLLSGRGPDWLRRPGTGAASLGLLAVSCVGLSWLGFLPLGLAAIAVFMIAQGHGYLVARSGIDDHTPASGAIWGRFNAIGDIGFLVGPVLAMTAYANTGRFAFTVLGAGTLAGALAYGALSVVLSRQVSLTRTHWAGNQPSVAPSRDAASTG